MEYWHSSHNFNDFIKFISLLNNLFYETELTFEQINQFH